MATTPAVRRAATLAFALAATLSGCGGDGAGPAPTPDADDTADAASAEIAGDAPVETVDTDVDTETVAPTAHFAVRIDGATLAVAGTSFALVAQLGGTPTGGVSTWQWELDDAVATGDVASDTVTLTFATTGVRSVRVTAQASDGERASADLSINVVAPVGHTVGDVDGDGAVTSADVAALTAALAGTTDLDAPASLRADVDLTGRPGVRDLTLVTAAVAAGAQAPRYLSRDGGSRGALLVVIHPALLDPTAPAELVFGDGGPSQAPWRWQPGYASTFVPLALDRAASLQLILRVGGQEVDRFPFAVEARLAPDGAPGSKLTALAQKLRRVGGAVADALGGLGEVAGLDANANAVIPLLATETGRHLTASLTELEAVVARMSPDVAGLADEVARANGLDDVLRALDALAVPDATSPGALTAAGGETLLDAICAARVLGEIMDKANMVVTIVEGVLLVASFTPAAPIAAPLLGAVHGTNLAVSFLAVLLELVPDLGTDASLSIAPAELHKGGPGELSLAVPVIPLSGLCGGGASQSVEKLTGRLAKLLVVQLAKKVPALSGSKVERLAADFVSGLLQIIIDQLEIDLAKVLAPLCDALDGLVGDLALPLDPLGPSADTGAPRTSAGCGKVVRVLGSTDRAAWVCESPCLDQMVALTADFRACGVDDVERFGGNHFSRTTSAHCIACDRVNCPEGCCSATGACVPLSPSTCAHPGDLCQACDVPAEICNGLGDCVCADNCSAAQVGERACADDFVTECQQKTAEPPCYAFTKRDDCAARFGATCLNGQCVGGCGPHNCPNGCCRPTGRADGGAECIGPGGVDIQSESQCGRGGAICINCFLERETEHVCENGACTDCRDRCPDGAQRCQPDGAGHPTIDAEERCTTYVTPAGNNCARWTETRCDTVRHHDCLPDAGPVGVSGGTTALAGCCGQEDQEPDDTAPTSVPLAIGIHPGFRLTPSDTDVFALTVPPRCTVTAQARAQGFDPVDFDLALTLNEDLSAPFTTAQTRPVPSGALLDEHATLTGRNDSTTITQRMWFVVASAVPAPGYCMGYAVIIGMTCARGCQTAADCDDEDACTIEECDPDTGVCHYAERTCTSPHLCVTGECFKESGCVWSLDDDLCDDEIDCTNDSCDLDRGCVHVPDDDACDDDDPCTTDVCDPEDGCQYAPAPDDTACPGGRCRQGACVQGGSCDVGLVLTCDDAAGRDLDIPIDDLGFSAYLVEPPPGFIGTIRLDHTLPNDAPPPIEWHIVEQGADLECGAPVPSTTTGAGALWRTELEYTSGMRPRLDVCYTVPPEVQTNALTIHAVATCLPACVDDSDCEPEGPCDLPACGEGVCVPGPAPCDDDESCTEDGCDPLAGCTHDPLDDGTPCPAGTCQSGVCTPPDPGACLLVDATGDQDPTSVSGDFVGLQFYDPATLTFAIKTASPYGTSMIDLVFRAAGEPGQTAANPPATQGGTYDIKIYTTNGSATVAKEPYRFNGSNWVFDASLIPRLTLSLSANDTVLVQFDTAGLAAAPDGVGVVAPSSGDRAPNAGFVDIPAVRTACPPRP